MGRQAVSDKRTRWYARKTGIPIERMLARGGTNHWIRFRTADDRHGAVHADGTFDVVWDAIPDHWSSCDAATWTPPLPGATPGQGTPPTQGPAQEAADPPPAR